MIHFTQRDNHIILTHVPAGKQLGALDYDIDDFAQEFSSARVSALTYKVTPELRKFLRHVFGDVQ